MHVPLLQIVSVFQPHFFQIPDHPAKLLGTAHELAYNHTPGYCFYQEKYMNKYAAQVLTIEDISLHTVLQGCLKKELQLQLPTSKW